MGMSTDVTLPRSQIARFPDRCVRCIAADPGHSLEFAERSIGWWTLVFWMKGSRVRVEVPCCAPCRVRLKRQRRLRQVAAWLRVILAVFVAFQLIGFGDGPLRKWLVMGVALLLLTPLFLWEVFRPPPFDLTPYSKRVEYEFKDLAYAMEFAELNGTDAVE